LHGPHSISQKILQRLKKIPASHGLRRIRQVAKIPAYGEGERQKQEKSAGSLSPMRYGRRVLMFDQKLVLSSQTANGCTR
jgi:hypothetical protein